MSERMPAGAALIQVTAVWVVHLRLFARRDTPGSMHDPA
jgi:hypothetical protein